MHSLRRAALRVAVHGSKAVVAMPRVAWAPKAPSPCTLPSVTVAFSRSFVATPRLANQVEDADKESNTQGAEAAAGEASFNEAELLKPENTAATQSGAQNAGTDTPYGLFVRNLIFDANEEHLRDAFAKYGQITKVAIARDARGLSRGYAFVFFTNADDMNKAAAGANGSFWHGRRIHAAPRIKSNREDRPKEHERLPLSEKTPTHSLYIGNIPYETTDAELNTMFRALDNVTDVRIAVDRSTGWPRGFAHADFSTPEAAMNAALKLESTTLLGRTLRIDFSQHTKRDLQKPRQERVSKSPSGNGGSIA